MKSLQDIQSQRRGLSPKSPWMNFPERVIIGSRRANLIFGRTGLERNDPAVV